MLKIGTLYILITLTYITLATMQNSAPCLSSFHAEASIFAVLNFYMLPLDAGQMLYSLNYRSIDKFESPRERH